jgi:DNA-directed RNA polymerase specialized sigma subunit
LNKIEPYGSVPGDWRYIPVNENTWIFDLYTHAESPEDKIISHIDGDDNEDDEPLNNYYSKSGVELLDLLPKKKMRDIIYMHLYEGKTFREIGEVYGFSRQYSHVLFHQGLKILQSSVIK